MKKSLLFLCSLVILGINVFSQEWTLINTGYPTNFNGVTYLDEDHLFAAGNDGKIYGSSDGGFTWSVAHTGSVSLNALTTLNSSTVIAVGWDGLIIRYNGTDWSPIPSGTVNSLSGVSFGDEMTGYAVGQDGIILKSTDGGLTWTNIRSQRGPWLSNVNALDPSNVATVSENGELLHSSDGGNNWTTLVIPGNPWMGDVLLTGPNSGWCCGTDGTLYYFDGTNLTQYDLGTGDGLLALAVISLFNDVVTGCMVGDYGSIFEFLNGEWYSMMSPTTAFLFALAFYWDYFPFDHPQESDSAYIKYCAGGENGTILLNTKTVVGLKDGPGTGTGLSLYPVPVTRGVCFLKGKIPPGGVDLMITDISGGMVYSQSICCPLTPIDLRHLQNGLYIARIHAGNKVSIEKLIISRN